VQQEPKLADAVILAGERDFRLSRLKVHPSTRQLVRGALRETLEPRVMQVLVALAQAEGAVVSTDALIQRCWDGRIVGENAIHRVISRVRHVAATIGEDSFRVETIPKVGYRLIVQGDGVPARASSAARNGGRVLALVATTALLVAATLGWRLMRTAEPAPLTVAIVAVDGRNTSAELARGLAVDLSGPRGLPAGAVLAAGSSPDSSYVVRLSGDFESGLNRTDIGLSARSGGPMLWSASFARRPGGGRGEIAARLGPILRCLAEAAGPDRLDAPTLQLYLSWCDRGAERFDEEGLALLRQIVDRAPRFARGLANLATGEALDLDAESPPAALRRTAEHLSRARALDPVLPELAIGDALILTEPARWGERLRRYEQGIAAAPDFAPLYYRYAAELSRVGRMQDSLRAARRAVTLDPFSASNREALISALAYSGQPRAAFRELEIAEQLWPGAREMRALRYRMELRYGDPRAALALHDQPDLFDMRNPPTDRVWATFIRARIDPRPASIDAAVEAFTANFHREGSRLPGLLQTMGQFGRVEEAYRLLADPAAARPARTASEVLFRSHMQPLLADRRFIAFAARIGLLRYWQESGRWPDFCVDPQLPYDCRAEAARLRSPSPGS
jgi:DNA-binding winged helix-turn-helix (wHTH) protein/tetratricopeptide (TPR) repeat protein